MKEFQEIDENDFYESKLKQARKIAGETHEIITPRSKSQNPVKLATSTKKIEQNQGDIHWEDCQLYFKKVFFSTNVKMQSNQI